MMKHIQVVIKSLIFIPLILALVFAIINNNLIPTIAHLIRNSFAPTYLIIGASIIIFITIISYFWGIRHLIRSGILLKISEKKFLLIVFLSAFVIGLISILSIDTVLFSDFKAYHETAIKIYSGKIQFGSVLGKLGNTYIRRAFVNIVPVYYLFGPSPLAVQYVYLILHLATGFMLYVFMKENLKSVLTARVSLIFFFSFPIAYFTLNIPSHDIAGLFYMMLCFFLFGKIYKNLNSRSGLWKVILLSVLFGFVIFILQLSRSTGTFLFYALFMLMLVFMLIAVSEGFNRRQLVFNIKRILFLFLIPLIAFYLLKKSINSSGLNKGGFFMMFVATDTSEKNRGSYSEIADYKRYYRLMDSNAKKDMPLGKFSSEIHFNFSDYISLLIKKDARLFRLGADFSWANVNFKSKLFWGVISGHWIFSIILRIALYIFAVFGLLALFKRRFSLENPVILLLFMWFVTLALLIFLGEVSPRYSYLFIVFIAVLASIGFLHAPALLKMIICGFRENRKTFYKKSLYFILLLLAGMIISMALLVLVMSSIYKPELIFQDLRNYEIKAEGVDNDRAIVLNDQLSLQEQPIKCGFFVPDSLESVTARWDFTVVTGRKYQLRGFVREKIDTTGSYQATLKLDELTLVDELDNNIRRNPLKYKTDYKVGYFSSVPMVAKKDFISLSLSIDKIADTIYRPANNELSYTFIEFVQLVEITEE